GARTQRPRRRHPRCIAAEVESVDREVRVDMKGASALSLRAAFQLIVLVGAVVPLAVVGVWLTNDTARSGRALLQTQLDTAAVSIAASVDARWQTRRGELALLSENEVIRRVLSQGRAPSGADS